MLVFLRFITTIMVITLIIVVSIFYPYSYESNECDMATDVSEENEDIYTSISRKSRRKDT